MSFTAAAFMAVSCVLSGVVSPECIAPTTSSSETPPEQLVRSADALDVMLTAQAALAWDVNSGVVLYEKNSTARRPVASLVKLLSTLVIAEKLSGDEAVVIPPTVQVAQRQGAHIRLPVGEHATVDDLLAASLIPSANDAIVTLATAAVGDETSFVTLANREAARFGLRNTHVVNATGLPGGEQYSTAEDVRQLLTLAYSNPRLAPYLNDAKGLLRTSEGTSRTYETTNDLLATYLPVLAAKTGYTAEAGENVALLTQTSEGHTIGIVILGSQQRFQDAKILAEWINRHYTWY